LGIREKMCNRRKGGDGNGRDRRQDLLALTSRAAIIVYFDNCGINSVCKVYQYIRYILYNILHTLVANTSRI